MTPTELYALKARMDQRDREAEADRKLLAQLEAGEWPKFNDKYWRVTRDLDAEECTNVYYVCGERDSAIGNCFRTRAEAEIEAVKIRTRRRLEKMADWNGEETWFVIYWNINSLGFEADNYYVSIFGPRFANRESCQAAIDAIGETDLKILFGVG
jgi:hypothetical protein